MAGEPGAETPSELMRDQGGRTEAGEPGAETPWSGEWKQRTRSSLQQGLSTHGHRG